MNKIMPGYFLVRISKEEQNECKQKIAKGSPFFMPAGLRFNSRNMEYGDILQIGEDVAKIEGWEGCQPGHILCFHHTVEDTSSTAIRHYFLYDDDEYNYYAVDEVNVRGYYDGEKVVPHPNFIFLKNIPCFESEGEVDSNTGNKIQKTEGGLLLITNWDENPSMIRQRSEKIKEHIESLSKSNRTPEIQLAMESMEEERKKLNRLAQRRLFLPYRIAWSNVRVNKKFGRTLVDGDVIYCYNKACLYISNFQIEPYAYIICPIQHIGFIQTYDN